VHHIIKLHSWLCITSCTAALLPSLLCSTQVCIEVEVGGRLLRYELLQLCPSLLDLLHCCSPATFLSVRRSAAGIEVEVGGRLLRYELLAVLEFSSDRKRMSVVVRSPQGGLQLISKGADNVMLARLAGEGSCVLVAFCGRCMAMHAGTAGR
jgi:hypothetical protein